MPTILELCEKYFETKNLYEVLNINKKASEKEVKKAYYKLSLKVHPDRVDEAEKEVATEKFKVLGKIHSILTDKDKKEAYDNNGIVEDDDDGDLSEENWMKYWKTLFKPITDEDISAYEKQYKGSETELRDLKRAYVDGFGDMNYILNTVPFSNCDEEPRFIELIKDLIKEGEVPEYECFLNEPAAKRKRRHNKYKREAAEAARLEEALKLEKEDGFTGNDESDLALIIKQKHDSRGREMSNFFDALAEKYGGSSATKKTNKRRATSKENNDSPSLRKRRKQK